MVSHNRYIGMSWSSSSLTHMSNSGDSSAQCHTAESKFLYEFPWQICPSGTMTSLAAAGLSHWHSNWSIAHRCQSEWYEWLWPTPWKSPEADFRIAECCLKYCISNLSNEQMLNDWKWISNTHSSRTWWHPQRIRVLLSSNSHSNNRRCTQC